MTTANDYRDAVARCTGLKPHELVCPREKSEHTPCVARDGDLACSDDGWCVGCDVGLKTLIEKEKARTA